MSIIAVVIALLFAASSAYVVVSAVRGTVVAPASVSQPRRPVIYRTQSGLLEPTARTADREQLRRYFLQGRADGRGPVFP